MKLCIFGDIHANLEALQTVLAECKALGVEKYVCIGDVVGYNANPHECMEIVRDLDLLAVVCGNHDSYTSSTGPLTGFNPQAAAAVEWTRKQLNDDEMQWLADMKLKQDVFLHAPNARFSVVHATLDIPEMWGYIFDRYTAAASMQYQYWPLCFFGHTHTPLAFEKNMGEVEGGVYTKIKLEPNRKYLINVGSVGQPRDRDPRAAFATYDLDEGIIELHRLEYDIKSAQRKIIAAGLPTRCAERLEYGH